MRIRRILIGVALLAAFGGPAFGHAKLLRTSPAADAVGAAPGSLTLTFNEAVRLAVLRLTTAGRAVTVTIDRNAAPSKAVTVALPPLTAGTYEVAWSALTPSDGHVVKGAYSFVVR